MDGGPCYQLYTKSFYEKVAGPAGVLTHKEIFSSIYNTLKHVFKYVIACTAPVPSFVDTWGWVLASDQPFELNALEINKRIEERINGKLLYLNGESIVSSTIMNKTVHQSLLEETHVYTEENALIYSWAWDICCHLIAQMTSDETRRADKVVPSSLAQLVCVKDVAFPLPSSFYLRRCCNKHPLRKVA
ncbi:hypothetical protein HPP92_018764 [Vanilla planifolia]|uniref:PABS domain-containing protein n=1 Tax=Vanilla planifolia TaxID=51239 RepID=A0A835Q1Q2_VANPL|nr:hypothetical protein HPP92_018764 [Vanilla planifolia]